MGKRKRKLSAAEKAAKEKRCREYETVFVNGKMKRVRRPMIDGMVVDDFIRANADPTFLHKEGLWEYLEPGSDPSSKTSDSPPARPAT